MLQELHIENIAVIEKVDVEFTDGLNILTGETGAGKSIVIDSLNAVLGGRTSRELVRTGAQSAVVSAVFTPEGSEAWRADNDIGADDDSLVLTRKISRDGKSSCRVNGVPVSVSQLRELGSLLLDIHGQNDGRRLTDENTHRTFLDGYGGLEPVIESFMVKYKAYRKTLAEIKRLKMDEDEKARLTESLKYQIEELEDAELSPGEESELTARRELLKNAGKLTDAVDGAYELLYGGDESAAGFAGEASALLERASGISPELAEAGKSVREAALILEDAAERLRDFRHGLDFSPEEYDELETRLALFRRLNRKYGAVSGDELIEKLALAKERLSEIEYADDKLILLKKELAAKRGDARAAAAELTEARQIAARSLEMRVVGELAELSMPSVRFRVELKPLEGKPGFDASGAEEVRFLISANAGEEPGRISAIASGGELSRIMLALKSVLAEKDEVQALVFDEIDTGVSGVAASRVGEKLGAISRHRQALCVTHLPQIAAMADTHFVIEKAERGGRTYTSVTPLDLEGRKLELARLHGGDNVTATTLESAAEQLAAAERFKLEHR